jgi:hypothetical protein
VLHLPESNLIVEVQTGIRTDSLSGLGAAIWLRIGEAGKEKGFLKRMAIWPLWSPLGGLASGEVEEVQSALEHVPGGGLSGGIVIRPALSHDQTDFVSNGSVLAITLGTEGAALRETLSAITSFLQDFMMEDEP